MAKDKIWKLKQGDGCLVAAAIHCGHTVREEVAQLVALTDAERLREEDPFTEIWTQVSDIRVRGLRSRFEVDLNRPRDRAVYLTDEDAWGLKTWKTVPSPDLLARSLSEYDAFYAAMYRLMSELEERHRRFLVLDLHSYNHRRNGPNSSPADPGENPEINIGTGTMIRERWGSIIDRLISDLRHFDFFGRSLDVRENVRFRGGHFPKWIHENFPASGCALALEVKKFFMDEWTGEPYREQITRIQQALLSAVPGILEKLQKLG